MLLKMFLGWVTLATSPAILDSLIFIDAIEILWKTNSFLPGLVLLAPVMTPVFPLQS